MVPKCFCEGGLSLAGCDSAPGGAGITWAVLGILIDADHSGFAQRASNGQELLRIDFQLVLTFRGPERQAPNEGANHLVSHGQTEGVV